MTAALLRLYLIPVLFFTTVSVYSQNNYIFHHYTNENGLPANGIKGIELDKKTGFLWIGTQAGLARFDGTYFKRFGSAKNPEAAFRINFISRNHEGTIYCEDEHFSVYQIKEHRPEFVVTDSTLEAPTMLQGGRFALKPLKQLTENLRRHSRSSFLPAWIIFNDETEDSTSFSILSFDHACHYDAATDSLFVLQGFESFVKLDGHVYFSRPNLELWEFESKQKKFVPVPVAGIPEWNGSTGEKPRFIWKPGMKEPLLIYRRNIWKLQRTVNGLELSLLCRSCTPADANIVDIQVWEEQGIIFLGSVVNGLYVVKNAFLQSLSADTLEESGKVKYAQAEIRPGVISSLPLYQTEDLPYRKTGIRFYPYTFFRDQKGGYWLHSKDTIVHFMPGGKSHSIIVLNDGSFKIMFAEIQNRIYAISDIAIGEVIGDHYRLIYKLPLRSNNFNNTLNPDAVIEWKPGILAIAAAKLVLFDTEKRNSLDTIPIPGLTGKVRSLLKYGDYLLIGTYGQGFYIYKNGIVKKMPLDNNQYLSYPHCFMGDDNGFCWISTNHGLFKASFNALVAAFERNLHEIYYQYFGKEDGISNTEFNGACQPCALKLGNGSFSFPSMNGVVVFNPNKQHALAPSGHIFIEEILADSVSYQANSHSLHTLPYNLKNLRFKLSLPQFSNQENIYFSYKLQPYSDDWETQDIIQNNILQFGGLKPGNYKLYLRVRNGFEPDQFGTTIVQFTILKPWYQKWWFYVLCFLAFITVTWGLVKWETANVTKRKKELQRQVTVQTESIASQSKQLEYQLNQLQDQQVRLEDDNKIKARLIAIISHDMISPIKFMGFVSKKLRDAFPSSDPVYRSAESMVTISQELESLSVNMLNWIRFHYETDKLKPGWFDLQDTVNESTEIASTLAIEKGIKLFNEVPAGIRVFQYRQAISVIIYNLAINAVKYTSTGEIKISYHSSGNYFSLILSDTGKGMSTELVKTLNSQDALIADSATGDAKKFQFGYAIIKDLIQLVNGSMKIESEIEKGTRVTISCKLSEDPAD
jgi:signal transduction histidine kinase